MVDITHMTELSNKNSALIKKTLEKDGECYSFTMGISMEPLFHQHRDIVVIAPVDIDSVKSNDVLLYKRQNYDFLPLHRVLKVREKDYVIRGDNTYRLEYVPKDYVVGVLKAFYRNGKYCDCQTNKKYKIYIRVNRITYPIRYLWKIKTRPFLSKIKHMLIK